MLIDRFVYLLLFVLFARFCTRVPSALDPREFVYQTYVRKRVT